MQTVNQEDLIDKIKADIEKQDQARIYYAFKKMRFKPLLPAHIKMIKTALACRKNGINVLTIELIGSVLNRKNNSLYVTLHNLGDKKVLTYLREGVPHKNIRWVLSPEFMKAYGEING